MTDTFLDQRVVDELLRCKEEGLYKALPEDIIRRRIQGKYRFMLQYHPSWDSTKRSVFNASPSMTEPFNPACFSFDKAKQNEILFILGYDEEKKHFNVYNNNEKCDEEFALYCYINVSPVAKNQHLYVPNPTKHYAQIYNPDFLHYFLSIFDLFQSPDYALFFNSLNGWASVNHQHWHGLFIHDFIPEDTKLPIQYQPTTVLKQTKSLTISTTSDWICHTLLLKTNEGCSNNEFVTTLNRCIQLCYHHSIPFNLFLTEHGTLCYLFLRTPQTNIDSIGYRAAFAELCGMTIVRKQQAFQTLTEEEVYEYSKIFKISDELFQQYKIDLLDQL